MNDTLTRMGEFGKLLSDISKAIRTMKSIQSNNDKLISVTEETKRRAREVESINLTHEQLPEELKPLSEELKPLLEELKPLLGDLKQEMRMVEASTSTLEAWLRHFENVTIEFDRIVRDIFESKEIPTHEFCKKLVYTHEMAGKFLFAFKTFMEHLNKSQDLATKLTDVLKEKADEMEKKAEMEEQAEMARQAEIERRQAETESHAKQKRNWGIGTAVGMIFGGIGLAALGFFTGGTVLLAAGSIAGISGFCSASDVEATKTTATGTAASAKTMREVAEKIMADSNTLDFIAMSLMSSSKIAAKTIQLNDEAIDALNQALAFWQKQLETLEKDEAQKREIAELKAKLRSHGID